MAFSGPPALSPKRRCWPSSTLAGAGLVPFADIGEVLSAVDAGEVSAGYVPIENSIEGTVPVTLDHLVFESELFIQAESCSTSIFTYWLRPGTRVEDIRRVISFPHASAQCRRYVRDVLGGAEVVASNSTAEAARLVGQGSDRRDTAAIAPMLAGRLYGLEAIAERIEDFGENQTRFLSCAPDGFRPRPDTIARASCASSTPTDPAACTRSSRTSRRRSLNLTKIESRPTKQGLGDYCFVIDLEGNVTDEVVGDCMKELHMVLAGLKFLGSYPAAGDHGPRLREESSARRQEAESWLASVREQLENGGPSTGQPERAQ